MGQLNPICIHVTKILTVPFLLYYYNTIWENEMGKEYSTHDKRDIQK